MIAPGDIDVLVAPFDGVVLGMTTLPAVSPGEPVYNLGRLRDEKAKQIGRLRRGLQERVVDDLATSVLVVKPNRREGGV